jgi:hypothetical protein
MAGSCDQFQLAVAGLTTAYERWLAPTAGLVSGCLAAAGSQSPPTSIETPVDTDADAASEKPAQTAWITSMAPAGPSSSPGSRDYNYFDELDSRLADLQDLDQGDG